LAPTSGRPTSPTVLPESGSGVSGPISAPTSSPSSAAIFKPRKPRSAATCAALAAAPRGLATPMLVIRRVPCSTQSGKIARRRRSSSGL
jgi:hypothetical protein